MCNCIEQLDATLNEMGHNTIPDVAIMWGANPPSARLKIAVVKRDDNRRTKPVSIIATYCPVCGEKYAEKAAVQP